MLLLGRGKGAHAVGDGIAEAVDFDGVYDYLSRDSDLAGNVNSKTFTLSVWVYKNALGGTGAAYYNIDNNQYVKFYILFGGSISILAKDASDNTILQYDAASPSGECSIVTWMHVLISLDLTDVAKRKVYLNDHELAGTWSQYNNVAIRFAGTSSYPIIIGGRYSSGTILPLQERLSHLYLDYTYRDLSVEANRRLFITADRKPASGQAALNPILYLPLDSPSTCHVNKGTGGDFVLNGTIARSGHGPNQFNAAYSDLDGSADYLSRTSVLSGVSNSKQVTLAFSIAQDQSTIRNTVLHLAGTGVYFRCYMSTILQINAYHNTTPPINFTVNNFTPIIGRNYHIVLSFDLSDSNTLKLYINGVSFQANITNYNDIVIPFSSYSTLYIGLEPAAQYCNGRLGNIYFNTSYIDLSDSDNLSKFCVGTGIDCKPVNLGVNGELPTGSPPLIYLPMYANSAGKNYGTGGDFTVNSGPFTGSRGPNEFWGNKAEFDETVNSCLARTSPLAISETNKFTFSTYFKRNSTTYRNHLISIGTGGSERFVVRFIATSGNLEIEGYNNLGTRILYAYCSSAASGCIQIAIDLSDTAKRFVYIDGVLRATTWSTYVDSNIDFDSQYSRVGSSQSANESLDGWMAETYFATEYIDFSQEANRLKFRDAFGNPVDLTPQIANGELPTPAIYTRFDPDDFGHNSGTGGDFSVNGTVTDGGQL